MAQLRPFTRVYNANDFNAGSTETDISCPASKWTKVGYVEVPAQSMIAFGAGAIANGVDSREYIRIRFDSTAGTQIAGKYRLAIANHSETDVRVIKEERSDNIGTASTVKLGESRPMAKEDSYLIIYLMPDATTTLDYDDADNIVLSPVTVYQ